MDDRHHGGSSRLCRNERKRGLGRAVQSQQVQEEQVLPDILLRAGPLLPTGALLPTGPLLSGPVRLPSRCPGRAVWLPGCRPVRLRMPTTEPPRNPQGQASWLLRSTMQLREPVCESLRVEQPLWLWRVECRSRGEPRSSPRPPRRRLDLIAASPERSNDPTGPRQRGPVFLCALLLFQPIAATLRHIPYSKHQRTSTSTSATSNKNTSALSAMVAALARWSRRSRTVRRNFGAEIDSLTSGNGGAAVSAATGASTSAAPFATATTRPPRAAGTINRASHTGQIPRLPARNALTCSRCPLGHSKRMPISVPIRLFREASSSYPPV